jgi:hypothetical protein
MTLACGKDRLPAAICFHQSMGESYRIIRHAAGAFAVEVTEPGGVPFIAGWFKSEAAARAYIQEQERMSRVTDRWE